MFDFHLHTKLSFDSETEPNNIVRAAEDAGLREICFTDHYDHNSDIKKIAESIGFHSSNYYSRVFKKRVGCAPSAYRAYSKTIVS